MAGMAPRRRNCSIALLTMAIIVGPRVAPDTIADPITYVAITGGVIDMTPGPQAVFGWTPAEVLLTGPDGFRLTASGITTTATCLFGCAPGDTILFGGPVYMETGSLSFQGTTHPFDVAGDPMGLGDLNFTSEDFFTFPLGSTLPLIVRRPIDLQFGALFVPGFFPPAFQMIPASGFATGSFSFGTTAAGTSAWQLQHVRFEIAEPVPEPASLLLLTLGLGVVPIVRRRIRT